MRWLSQPSFVNECPLVVPNTSRPLRLCVRNKNMFLCSSVQKNLWVPCEKFQASTRSIMSFCSSVRIIVPHRTHRTPQNLLRTLSRKSAPSAWHNPLRMVLCIPCIPCEKFQASTRSIMFFCQNYRPTEIRVLQTLQKSAPSAWNKKCPLVVPKTSRPSLREKQKYVLMFFCPKKICEFREFCVKIKKCSSCQKQSFTEIQ